MNFFKQSIAWNKREIGFDTKNKNQHYYSSNTYQKASAEEDTKPAIGFVKVSDSEEGEIQLFGPMDGFTGLVAGTRYYLDTVEGDITPTSPNGQGNIKQVVGRALSATRLLVSIGQDYIINP